jgi:acetoin utilization protein AcuB
MKVQLSETINKKVFTVRPEMSIYKAYGFLRECRVRHLVVVDDQNHVVGVISDRDFQRAMQTSVEKTGSLKIVGEHFNPEHSVQDFMSWEVQTLHDSVGIKQAALKMLESKISSLVVVNDENKMVGFMTSDDLLWVLTKIVDEDDSTFLEDLKAQIMNSPLGSLVNSISQTGI